MLAVLFLITLQVFKSSGQPCDDQNSIDLSDGEVFGDGTTVKNGVSFPPKYVYSRNVSGEIRSFGCLCAVTKCLRKCCDSGSVMLGKNCTVMPDMDILLRDGPKLYFKDAFRRQVKIDSHADLHMIHGRPPSCDKVYLEDEPWFIQEMLFFLILVAITVSFVYIYFNSLYNEKYWHKRGVTFHSDNKKLGIFWEYFTKNRPLFEVIGDLYTKYPNEPAIGITAFGKPAIYVRDITNVQHVLQQDFKSFNHRGIDVSKDDKLTDSILFMNGKRWKLMRQNMSPLFTATKLKNMHYIMDRSGQDFVDYLNKHPEKLNADTFDTLTTFCCAAIVASVFGLGTESIFDSPFLDISRKALEPTLLGHLKFAMAAALPRVFVGLNMKLFGEHEDFFIAAVKQVIRQREKETQRKHDFPDTAVSLQRSGMLRDPETNYEMAPTDELMAAQAFFFLVAGVEPSATAMFSTLLELGLNPDIVQKVQVKIDSAFEKNNGKVTYDDIAEMEYLDKVLNEGLRKYPPVGFLTRRCVENTVLPVGNIKIDEGTNVYTPLYSIHHDPRYFPNPEVFDPDRSDDASTINGFMPFGKGNRICIGARFTRLQIKTGLVHLLRHFTPKSEVFGEKIEFKKLQFQVRPENVNIKLIPRKV